MEYIMSSLGCLLIFSNNIIFDCPGLSMLLMQLMDLLRQEQKNFKNTIVKT